MILGHEPTIYHGTPMTPRAALLNIMPGRAGCVSFARPDDVDPIEQLCPRIMYDNGAFRFWQLAIRAGLDWAEDRDWRPFLSMDRAATCGGSMGRHSRHARCAKPAQRRIAERLALRTLCRAALAHGRAARKVGKAMRTIRSRLFWMDRQKARSCRWVRRLPAQNGRGFGVFRQSLASAAHDARNAGRSPFPFQQRRQHVLGAERMAL